MNKFKGIEATIDESVEIEFDGTNFLVPIKYGPDGTDKMILEVSTEEFEKIKTLAKFYLFIDK